MSIYDLHCETYPPSGITADGTISIASGTSTLDLSNVYHSSAGSWTISTTTSTNPVYVYDRPLTVEGGADISGGLKVDGVDIGAALKRIEERLAVLRPNPELEEKWTELKELGHRYRQLEEEILSKEKVYGILKD